jgi:hypothetical protein
LQQKGNHGVSDDPPKTLSSRSQTLSKLLPVEPPQGSSRRKTPKTLWQAAGARVPRGGRKTAFSATPRAEQPVQNRSIGTLARQAQARYPLASVQCANSAQSRDYLQH